MWSLSLEGIFFFGGVLKALRFSQEVYIQQVDHPIPAAIHLLLPLAGVWWVDASRSLGGSQTCRGWLEFGEDGFFGEILGLLMATRNPANRRSPLTSWGWGGWRNHTWFLQAVLQLYSIYIPSGWGRLGFLKHQQDGQVDLLGGKS